MPWIESHTELARHPKTLRLARRLGASLPTTIGHLHLLWWWAIEFAQDGDLAPYDDAEVAAACGWEGDPAALREALTAAGFLDGCGVLHDWRDYAGKLLDQRKANAEKQARWRNRHRLSSIEEADGDVTVTSPSRNGATVPNRTVPNQSPTTAKRGTPDADAPAPLKARGNPKVATLIDALRSEGMTGTLTDRDRKAIRATEHDAGEVAALYAAIFRGTYGDDFMHDNLSVSLCLEKLPGWRSHRAGHTAPGKNGAPRSASSRIDAVFERAMQHGNADRRRDAAVGDREAGRRLPPQLPG
jgi:hypothetical protein